LSTSSLVLGGGEKGGIFAIFFNLKNMILTNTK
jgi:hypothetical protein